MAKETEKSAQYLSGYLGALQGIFDELAKMHHDPKKFDRKVIDRVWDKVKEKELRARNGIFEDR